MIHHRYVAPFKGISVVCAVALVVLFGFAANFAQARGRTERTFLISIVGPNPTNTLVSTTAVVTDTLRKNNPTHIEGNVPIELDIASLGITGTYNDNCAGTNGINPIPLDITVFAGDWVVTVSPEVDAMWMGLSYVNAGQTFALQLLGEWFERGLPDGGRTVKVPIKSWTNRKKGGGAKRRCKVTVDIDPPGTIGFLKVVAE